MKIGRYRLIKLTTVRNKAAELVLGTLYVGDHFELLRMAQGDKYKDSWAWGFADGRDFKSWGWIALVDKAGQHALDKNHPSTAKHTWSGKYGGSIEESMFLRHKNKSPHNDGAKTKVILPAGKKHTRLRGNLNVPRSVHDVPLYNNAEVKWRYITRNGDFVLVSTTTYPPRWGFIPRSVLIQPNSKLPSF
jgi:hypothetical protein